MKYIRLLYPFAGAMPGSIMTISDEEAEAAVKSGAVEIVGQEAASDPEPTQKPAPVADPEKEPAKPVRTVVKRGKK